MNAKPYNQIDRFKIKLTFISILLLASLCKPEVINWEKKTEEMQITDYVESNEQFSEFKEALHLTKFNHLLKTRGPYTLFLPNNDAMFSYYEEKKVGSLAAFDSTFLKQLVLNHLVVNPIQSSDIGLGSLPSPNGAGDYLVTEFSESDIILNKKSKIIDRDIIAANGIIHVIDKTIDLVTDNVYAVLAADSNYRFFAKGLEMTGIKDTLEVISLPYGSTIARTRFTILAVPDSIYINEGINSYEKLVEKYDDSNGSISDLSNGFYKYMDYHCLVGTYYLSTFTNAVYPILSRENTVNIQVDTDYKINLDSTNNYTGFIIPEANIPGKNGVIHGIDNLLPPIDPIPLSYRFDVLDYPDVKTIENYGITLQNFRDGENTFVNIKWNGNCDYLQYWRKTGYGFVNDDCIVMSNGNWWLEITVPKIRKGKYRIDLNTRLGYNRCDFLVYIDGVKAEDKVYNIYSETLVNEIIEITDFIEWTETTEHIFRFETVKDGMLFLDYLLFEPIE